MSNGTNAIEKLVTELEQRGCNPVHRRTGFQARCPAHDDRSPSLSIGEGGDGRALIMCHAGCRTTDVVAALGLTIADLGPAKRNGVGEGGVSTSPDAPATVQPVGCTLAQYAVAKNLPVELLTKLGLSDQKWNGSAAVRIPYLDDQGSEVAVRFRTALAKSEGRDDRFRWRRGDKPCLYGLDQFHRSKKGYVVLVEGESDAHTLCHYGIHYLGVPGSGAWREEWVRHFDGVAEIYLVREPDAGGKALLQRLSSSGIRDRLRVVDLPETKDVSELHLRDPDGFVQAFNTAMKAAQPWSELARLENESRAAAAWQECAGLAQETSILDRFAQALETAGLVGEERSAKILYLCLVSRLLERPVSVAVKGPSSAGKSFLVQSVLGFFPSSAHYSVTAMSERALAYSDEPLVNRYLVLYEAAGLGNDFASYLMRSLLSEGRLRYETVERTNEGLRHRLIERLGPTGLVVTTTAPRLHPENETRMLSLLVADTREQTRSVIRRLAEVAPRRVESKVWHAHQEWLATGEKAVEIPYATRLADAVPPVAVRLRRDFETVLTLIRAHALLHRATRGRNEHGAIVATLEDYSAVRELVENLIAEGTGAGVSETMRQTVEAVRELHECEAQEGNDSGVPVVALASALKIDKSSASRRARAAVDAGYLRNLEDRRGRPLRLVPGEAMPEKQQILPRAEDLGE